MGFLWVSLLLGVVEGLTEFLPISSTGHLVVASHLVGFEDKRAEVFQVFIQLGAILAVVWEYRAKLLRLVRELPTRGSARRFVALLTLAFLPSALLGVMVYSNIVQYLFSPFSVALALIVGGLLIFVVEAIPIRVTTHEIEAVGWRQGAWIGVAQCLALWPGFSRSAATILGGLCVGLDRRSATEFSFFLAIPTMVGATCYNLARNYQYLEPSDLSYLAISFAVSFLVGWISVRWLLQFVANHTFRLFAWYRLAFGAAILLIL